MKYVISVLIIGLFLTGCAGRMSAIAPASETKSEFADATFEGEDTYVSTEKFEGEKYRIFHHSSSGFTPLSAVIESATDRAEKFCRKKGRDKEMFIVKQHTSVPPHILGNYARAELIFVCVGEDENSTVYKKEKDKYDKLNDIKRLLDSGVLTKEEFDIEKKKILSGS